MSYAYTVPASYVDLVTSYGSGIAANILRDAEFVKYVKAAVLMDPICFMLHLPGVAYNFVSQRSSDLTTNFIED